MSSTIVVLLVEDEPLIQDMIEYALEDGGFAVVKACSGKDAIATLQGDGAAFQALVSDVYLGPGPTGWEVARRACELNELLPVVYVSGGNAHEWAAQGVPNSILISKPFAPAQILTAVAKLLSTNRY